MGIISLASGNSCWRGLDYYKSKNVIKLNKINENEYSSIVKGTSNYNVHLDIEHPKKSTCDCPLANGKRIKCLNKMSKEELIQELIQIFDYGPEWIYNDFVKRNLY